MFGSNVFLTPGQELKDFDVLSSDTTDTERGRIISSVGGKRGSITAVLAAAKYEERERWHQTGRYITHKLIHQGVPDIEIIEGDILERNGRGFYVRGVYNPGELNHWVIYYCEERTDV